MVFASILNTLTDLGFRVTAADASTGFITATGGGQERISVGLGGLSRDSEVPVVSAFVEERPQGFSVVRVVFAKSALSTSTRLQSVERVIYEAGTYNEFFTRLDREIQLRSGFRVPDEIFPTGHHPSLLESHLPYVIVPGFDESLEPFVTSAELAAPE